MLAAPIVNLTRRSAVGVAADQAPSGDVTRTSATCWVPADRNRPTRVQPNTVGRVQRDDDSST